jgi:hypothetical protein
VCRFRCLVGQQDANWFTVDRCAQRERNLHTGLHG